jgi:single-strand DNA-binding protein
LSVHLVKISSLTLATLAVAKIEGARMAAKSDTSKGKASTEEKIDLSLNDLLVRGRVSAPATVKELPSGDKVVEFRLIVSRIDRDGVDTLDIAAWSGKSRKTALSLKSDEWIEVSGSVHRRFWQSPAGLASRWQIEAAEITRL